MSSGSGQGVTFLGVQCEISETYPVEFRSIVQFVSDDVRADEWCVAERRGHRSDRRRDCKRDGDDH